MEEQEKKARNLARKRKRNSRAVMAEFKTDCEKVLREDFNETAKQTDCFDTHSAISSCENEIQNDEIQSIREDFNETAKQTDCFDTHSAISSCENEIQNDELQSIGDSSFTADLTEDLRDEVIALSLQENMGSSDSSNQPEEIFCEIDELRKWAVDYNITHASLDQLLSILRKRVLLDLPKSATTFLQTRKVTYNITEMDDHLPSTEPGQFVYFGIAHGLETCIVSNHSGDIRLIVSVDGLPLTKSGKKFFWPILCRVYYKPDLYKPFVVAVYCGSSKPKSVNDFFYLFIKELNDLQRDGIVLHGKHLNVCLMCIAADTPARSYCKGTKGHGGYSACERCVVYGERIIVGKGYHVVYPGIDYENRSDTSFRDRSDPEHHNGDSPLENIKPKVDMTTIFPLDFMHLVCIGATKKLLEMLMIGPLKVRSLNIRLSVRQKNELSRRMLSLKAFVPAEFQRKPTSINWLYKWKATEFRFFLLYCGPIVLRNLMHRELYRHFLLLHAAFRILCSESLALQYNNLAKAYLQKFVMALPLLYGERSQVINMHNLLHIADDVRIFGCSLNHINCFPSESCLGSIKRVLRAPNKPLEQFCRRKGEKDMLFVKPAEFPQQFSIVKSVIEGEETYISKLTLNYGTTITTTMPNNVVLLDDGCIMEIDEIYGPNASFSSLKIVGKIWKCKTNIYAYPTKSSFFQMWKLPARASTVRAAYPLTRFLRKIVKMNVSFKPCVPATTFFVCMLHE